MDVLDKVDLASLAIVKYPQPVLRRPAQEVTEFGPKLRALAARMFQIMYAARGVGLAAPQVGLPLRMFVANPGEGPETEAVFINPRIIKTEGQLQEEEGCLSLPGLNTTIKRCESVTIQAQDLDGRPLERIGAGLLARVFQHETDHLNGVMIADRMSAVSRLAHRRLLKELEEKFAAEKSG